MTKARGSEPVERVEKIDGSDLHYWTYRDDLDADPPVVMVHGLRGSHQGLELIVEGLTDRRVVVPDLPGFGDSTPMVGRRHDVEGYAGAVTALIECACGRDRPVVLLGHSFGSLVAAHVAATTPGLVSTLVLVNSLASPALSGPRVLLSRLTLSYYWLGKELPGRLGRALLSNKWIVRSVSRAMTRTRDKRIRQFIVDSHLRYFSRFASPALVHEAFHAAVSRAVADYAAALTVPTVLIAGDSDEIAPLAGQRALADRLADCTLVVMPQAGHLVHYETPDAVAEVIRDFLGTRELDAL